MKLDDIRTFAKFQRTHTPEDQQRMQAFLREMGIDPTNLYQELEMPSRYVNTHRDTSFSNGNVSLHSHNYYEIIYCRSTCGVEYLIGSERYRLQSGDIVFVPPEVSHRPILPDKMDEPYVRDVLWISREFMELFKGIHGASDIQEEKLSIPFRSAGTRWEFLGDLFRNGVAEEEQRRPGWEAAVMGNTMMILVNLGRAHRERSVGTLKAEKPELLDRIAAFIEGNYQNHITVGDLSRQFYVSDSTISHLFKQKMGVSLYRYITQRRLIAAKKLIQEGHSMEDVSRIVGFSDYSTFYRAFKQEYGISPRQFSRL